MLPEIFPHWPTCFLLPFLDRERMFLTDFIPISKTIIGTEGDDALLGRVMDAASFKPMEIQIKGIHEPHRTDKQALIMETT